MNGVEFESKWLQFAVMEEKPKTKVYGVYTKKGAFLGLVEWYSPWRQYCFTTIMDTVWAASCIDDLSRFIKELMKSRDEAKERKA